MYIPQPILVNIFKLAIGGPLLEKTWLSVILLNKKFHTIFTANEFMSKFFPKFGAIDNTERIYDIIKFRSKLEYDIHVDGVFTTPIVKTYFGTFHIHDLQRAKYASKYGGAVKYFSFANLIDKKILYETVFKIPNAEYKFHHNIYYEKRRKPKSKINLFEIVAGGVAVLFAIGVVVIIHKSVDK